MIPMRVKVWNAEHRIGLNLTTKETRTLGNR